MAPKDDASESPMSDRTTTVLAVLVLAGFVALLIFVPHELLRPLSVGYVVFAVAAVFGIRAYRRRLEAVAVFLASDGGPDGAPLLGALLTEPERRFLLLFPRGTAADMSQIVRKRQSLITSIGMFIAVTGFCAFLVTVFFYSV